MRKFMTILFILLFLIPNAASATDYSSWSYTRPVTITNSGNSLTDYPVLISLDTETLISDGKMNPDCSDLRVSDESDNPLSYWIESPYELEDYALASKGATVTGSTNPSYAIDGQLDYSKFWSRSASSGEMLYDLGTVDLGQLRKIGVIGVHLWDGDTRYYYNYKVEVSSDNVNWETWFDGTSSGTDYNGLQIIEHAEENIRYIHILLSGNTLNAGANVIEVYAYGPSSEDHIDYALASRGATATGSSYSQHAIDGGERVDNSKGYWLRGAQQTEYLYEMGTIDLGQSRPIDEIGVHLWDGDDRYYFNYKIAVSSDNVNWETWFDGTGSGKDYRGTQMISRPIQNIRYINVWLSGNTQDTDAHIIELYAYGPETSCDTGDTRIWVNIPSLPASSEKTISLHYGNPYASDECDPDNVFDFYDDFESGLGKWSLLATSTTSNINLVSDKTYSGSNSVEVYQTVDDGDTSISKSISSSIKGILDVKFYDDTSVSGTHTIGSSNFYAGIYSSDVYGYRINGGSWYNSLLKRSNGWHTLRYVYDGSSAKAYLDGGLLTSTTSVSQISTVTVLDIWDVNHAGLYHDNVLLRKYASPEPTTLVLAESVVPPLTMTETSWQDSFADETGISSRNDIDYFYGNLKLSKLLNWYDHDWDYVKSVTISGSSEDLIDYQVHFMIDTGSLISGGKMNSDCSDIRFWDNYGNSYSYWIESGCNTDETKIWVKIPSLTAGSDKTIYLYYGNPSASAQSNPHDVFDFYDDFEEYDVGNLNGQGDWEASSGNSFKVSSSNTHTGSRSIYYDNGQASGDSSFNDLDGVTGTDIIFSFWYYLSDGGDGDVPDSIVLLSNPSTWTYAVGHRNSAKTVYHYKSSGNNYWSAKTLTRNEWHNIQLFVTPSGTVGVADGETIFDDMPMISLTSIKVYVDGGCSSRYDDMMIRKYASPGPTVAIADVGDYHSSGILYSDPIEPPLSHTWQKLIVSQSVPEGTSITYSIINVSNGYILCSGMNSDSNPISGCAEFAPKIKLKAEFMTTNPAVTPVLNYWNVTWENVYTYTINGTVRNLAGDIVPFAYGVIQPESADITADENGYYEVSGIGSGNHNVICDATNYKQNSTVIDITQNITFDIYLEPDHKSFYGVVTDPNNNPLVDVHVVAYNETATFESYTDGSGQYVVAVPNLNPANSKYNLSASKSGYIGSIIYDQQATNNLGTQVNFILGMITASLTSPFAEAHIDPQYPDTLSVFSIGSTNQLPVLLRNPTDDYIVMPLHIGTDDSGFSNLVRLDAGDYQYNDLNITLGPHEERYVLIDIIAGKKGTFNVTIGPDDNPSNKYDSRTVRIVEIDRGLFSSTPGLEPLSLLFVIISASLIVVLKR